jgi:hypothetical protein
MADAGVSAIMTNLVGTYQVARCCVAARRH